MDTIERDAHNTKFLMTTLIESGPEGLLSWFLEQSDHRKAYVVELLQGLGKDLTKLSQEIDRPPCVVIPLHRKPKFRLVK